MRKIWLVGIFCFLGLLFWRLWVAEPYFFFSAHHFFQQAQESLRLDDASGALAAARLAHQKDPHNPNYTDFLAWRCLELKHPREALDLFRQAWNARPSSLTLQGQVLALEQLANRTEALHLLETYLISHPQDISLLKLAGDLAAQNPATQAQAIIYYQRLSVLNPQNVENRRRLVDLLTAGGHFAEAIPVQEQILAEDPDDPQALHQLALLYAWQRDYQAAAPIYQKLLELAADNQALRLEAAKNADAAHNLDQALSHYLRLYAQSGGQKEYGLILARLWSQKGNHADAAAVLAPIMADHPSLEQRRLYALELLLAQNFSQSLKAYRQAWEAGDSHKETILNLARLHARKEQFRQAANFWDEARRRQLLDPELRREAALTYSYARRYQDAIKILQNLDRRDPKLLLFLGQMHFYQKNWDQAAHYYQEYLTQVPEDAAARQQLAQALSYAPGRLAEAATEYDNTANLTGDPQLLLQKAAILLQLAQDASDEPRQHDQAPAKWAAAAAALQQLPAEGLRPELLLEQARLLLWLGELEPALDRLDTYLAHAPQDRQALMDRARTLIYLQRGSEAAEILRRLPPEKPSPGPMDVSPAPRSQSAVTSNLSPDRPVVAFHAGVANAAADPAAAEEISVDSQTAADMKTAAVATAPAASFPLSPRGERTRVRGVGYASNPATPPADVLTLFLEAALADRNWPEARRRAWQLYLTQLAETSPKPQTWTAARRRLQEDTNRRDLSPGARVDIARALCRQPHLDQEQDEARAAVDLCLANLNSHASGPDARRTYQASCLLLAYLLPRLNYFDDLQSLVHRLPGIREKSPEYIAALHYFTESLGRQGGKLQYLLHTLEDRQETHRARSPGDLMYLAAIASELGDKRTAVRYLDQALRLRPLDQRLSALRLQALLAANDAGRVLQVLEGQPASAENALEMGRVYLQRQQYEGAIAVLADIPQSQKIWPQARMLLIEAHRGRQDYPEALAVIGDLESRGQTGPALLMAKAQVLESMDDRAGAQTAYQAAAAQAPDAGTAEAAKARLARFRGDWAGAYRHFAAALRNNPQDVELLNELEQVREQMRPVLAARNLPSAWRGERRPEEALRPWQFGRYDREPGVPEGFRGSMKSILPLTLPSVLIPETTLFEDRNHIKGLQTRLSGSLWLSRVVPLQLALGYQVYRQDTTGPGPDNLYLGLHPVFDQSANIRTTWQRAEATLALGPLVLGDKIKITGELSGRRYWKDLKQQVSQYGQTSIPLPPVIFNTVTGADLDNREARNRLLGSFALQLAPGPRTDLTLRYSRSDIFDNDPAIFPRLYQQVIRLDTLTLVTLDQINLAASHQFFPGLSYQANVAESFFSDYNQRFSLYQGLRWQALDQPRMHLDITPSYYLALYRRQQQSYFSPHTYQALGVSLDFDRQLFQMPILAQSGSEASWFLSLFRLSTLVLQTTAQMVDNAGRYGPALATLAGLESEPVQNLYVGLHYFYFKEWVSNYWLQSLTLGLKWRF